MISQTINIIGLSISISKYACLIYASFSFTPFSKMQGINQMHSPPHVPPPFYHPSSHPIPLRFQPGDSVHSKVQSHLLIQQQGELRRRSSWSCGDFSATGYGNSNNENADTYEQEEASSRNQHAGKGEVERSMRREAQRWNQRTNWNAHIQGGHWYNNYNNYSSRYRPPYPKQSMQQSLQYKQNLRQLSRLHEANREARAQKQHRENICSRLRSQLGNGVGRGQKEVKVGPIEMIKGLIEERKKAYQVDIQTNNQLISKIYEQSRQVENQHQSKYKQLGVYLKMNKQKEENEKLFHSISRKEEELQQLVAKNQIVHLQMTEQSSKCKKEMQAKRASIKQLASKIQLMEINLQKWLDQRFRLKQKCVKQERLNNDVAQLIAKADDQIRKEAEADERIRLENLKLMENLQCQHEDLSHERLRILQQKFHELKLLLLSSTKILEQKELQNSKVVPFELIEQRKSKITTLISKLAHHENKIRMRQLQKQQIEELSRKLSSLEDKQKLKQQCDRIKLQVEALELQSQRIEAEKNELKTTLIEINDKIKFVADSIAQEQKRLMGLKKQREQPKRCSDEDKQLKQNKIAPKVCKNWGKKTEKGMKEQAPSTQADTYYVKKKLKPIPFILTVLYLIVLLFGAIYYKEVSRQFPKLYPLK